MINEEEHKYRLECEDAGTEPNGWTGDLMCLDDIDELEDAQLTKLLVPGTDEEDEESYRMRIEDSFGIKPFAGNKAYYKEEVEAIDGVGGEKTYRRKGSSRCRRSSMQRGRRQEMRTAQGQRTFPLSNA